MKLQLGAPMSTVLFPTSLPSFIATRNRSTVSSSNFNLFLNPIASPSQFLRAVSMRCFAGSAGIDEKDGDKMTRVIWSMIKDKLSVPYLDLDIKYCDLGILNCDAIDDKVTVESAEAVFP